MAAAPLTVHPLAPLFEAAIEIAMRTGRTVYDSQYVALSLQLSCQMVTADEKLYNAVKEGPLGDNILWVEDDLGIPGMATDEDSVNLEDSVIPPVIVTVSADEIELQ